MVAFNSKLKELIFRSDRKRREFVVKATNFTHENKDALVIICDPQTDVMVVAQGSSIVASRFKTAEGKRMHIVADALHYLNSKTDKSIDQFLLAVDSALFNLAQRRYNIRKGKPLAGALVRMGIGTRPDLERDGSQRAPYQFQPIAGTKGVEHPQEDQRGDEVIS